MVKTLEQINREFMKEYNLIKMKKKDLVLITDIALYAAIFFILIAALFFNGKTKGGFQIFGYSGYTVLSGSMQSEIPEGSLVITQKVGLDKINTGDDITFINKDNSIVTHRVIGIIENSENSIDRGFQTQGLENNGPDQEVIYAENVIGVVKHTVPGLGSVLNYISKNIGIFLLISIITLVIIKFLIKVRAK